MTKPKHYKQLTGQAAPDNSAESETCFYWRTFKGVALPIAGVLTILIVAGLLFDKYIYNSGGSGGMSKECDDITYQNPTYTNTTFNVSGYQPSGCTYTGAASLNAGEQANISFTHGKNWQAVDYDAFDAQGNYLGHAGYDCTYDGDCTTRSDAMLEKAGTCVLNLVINTANTAAKAAPTLANHASSFFENSAHNLMGALANATTGFGL